MLLKGAVLPLLAWFAAVYVARGLARAETRADLPRRLAQLALMAVIAGAMLLPYMASSQRIFGVPYYNVNTTFYLWYDSWAEAEAGTKAHGDRVGWPDMPADELPSLSRYLATHTAADMLTRVGDGLERSYRRHCAGDDSYGYCKYIAVYGAAALAVVAANRDEAARRLRRHGWLAVFAAGYVVLTLLLAAWWVPINAGRRFMLPALLPLLFSLAVVIHLPGWRPLPLRLWRPVRLTTLFDAGVLALVVADAYLALAANVGVVAGGD
jgi:hypothetical protein